MDIMIITESSARPVLGTLVADEQGARYRMTALKLGRDGIPLLFGISACDPQGQFDSTPEFWREDMQGWTFVD